MAVINSSCQDHDVDPQFAHGAVTTSHNEAGLLSHTRIDKDTETHTHARKHAPAHTHASTHPHTYTQARTRTHTQRQMWCVPVALQVSLGRQTISYGIYMVTVGAGLFRGCGALALTTPGSPHRLRGAGHVHIGRAHFELPSDHLHSCSRSESTHITVSHVPAEHAAWQQICLSVRLCEAIWAWRPQGKGAFAALREVTNAHQNA